MLLAKLRDSVDSGADFDPFGALSLFDRSFTAPLWNESRSFVPSVEVSETDDYYKVSIETPGMKKEDIQIEIEDDVLTLSGEKKVSNELKDEKLHRVERLYGSFRRSFKFRDIDSEKVTAVYANGVLQITAPKAPGAKPRRIEIG